MATDSTSTSKATARPSSSTSDVLLGAIFARGRVAAAVSDAAFVQAMLDVEVAHARATLPAPAAEAVAAVAVAERFDLEALAQEAARHATPVIGLVAALREQSGEDGVHRGLTSQDVVDTGLMLMAQRALSVLSDDAAAAADATALLAETHRTTPILARTLMQPAQPTSFGLKAAGWLVALDDAGAELTRVRDAVLAAQVGGAVGNRAALADDADAGARVAAAIAAELGLVDPILPWHGDRRRAAQLAAALGVLAGTAAKIAADVVLLAQGEVAEVRDGVAGGSSAMAHKANPVAAISARACAARVPGLVATMLSVMDGEHERAAGGWQAEWETLRELLRSTGAAVAWLRELLERLEVDAPRMEANLVAVLGDAAAPRPDTGPLIDRALAAHRAR
ncbi:3-carboxy-cis,cis-muconate cycloisomerase [Baekduia alba]|uniref:lyase family protein n=1 Tax=Baekduia alba TaxID=2997333 RepID=UPI002340BDDD|nr:lyase family protein [Baekduia alba]WCB94419.1 3-carboxy-cis,cis-muconate cycloisomerase [Baekduia alba]